MDFLPLKSTIAGPELQTAVVVCCGATQWIKFTVQLVCDVQTMTLFTNIVQLIIYKRDEITECLIHEIYVVHSSMYI